jgi:hypothetical protein
MYLAEMKTVAPSSIDGLWEIVAVEQWSFV